MYTNEESLSDEQQQQQQQSEFSSDTVLAYINQVLMEEEEDNYITTNTTTTTTTSFPDPLALQQTEKSFYDVIVAHNNYPPPPPLPPLHSSTIPHNLYNYNTFSESPYHCETLSGFTSITGSSSSSSSSDKDTSTSNNLIEFNMNSLFTPIPPPNFVLHSNSNFTTINSVLEQGSTNFLPIHSPFIIHPPTNAPPPPPVVIKTETDEQEHFMQGRKTWEQEYDYDDEEDDHLQNGSSDTELSQLFDRLLLLGNTTNRHHNEDESNTLPHEGGGNRKNIAIRRRRQMNYYDQVVDLRTLLLLCAQAISFDDISSANQFLKQIKQHSSPTGDATQRLSYFFGNALQARLNGTGSQIYKALSFTNNSAVDMIRAYQLYNSASPFEKLAIMFANNTIWNNTPKEAQTLHIIDFGVRYGFKWPAFINRISKRPNGPPKLRITGIDLPNSLHRVHETGRRLASYCERFNVQFEFNAIAKQWECINVEELDIRGNEFVAVNCLFGFENLPDETVVLENPRDSVLDLIHKANPNIFVHGIVNGSYDAPFFETRFKEALFHYSALFDMLHNNIGGGEEEDSNMRLMFEEEFWGKEIMNVIACEGCERVERPETYKQWQIRLMRSKFRSMSLDQQVIKKLEDRLRDDAYSSDFMLEVDGNWFLQGWKGKILYASSAWIPQ